MSLARSVVSSLVGSSRGVRTARGLFALAGAALVAACGQVTSDHIRPELPLWVSRPSGAIELVFRRSLSAPSRKVGEELERGRPEIDRFYGRVFVGSTDHGLYALKASDGSTIWRFETMAPVQSEPYYDEELDAVFFGSNDGALYAVRARDGGLLFRYDTKMEVFRKPVRVGEKLIFANVGDQLFCLDRRTGDTKWKTGRTPALGMEIAGHAGPMVRGNRVYFAFSDGHVSAYDVATGEEKWSPVDLTLEAESSKASDLSKFLDVDTTPVYVPSPTGPGLVIAASFAGGLFALDPDNGGRVWANTDLHGATDMILFSEPAHLSRPSPSGEVRRIPALRRLIVSSTTTGLWSIDPYTGKTDWRNKLPEGGISAPTQMSGAIMVGTSRYGLFLISPISGLPIDGIDPGTGFSSNIASYGNKAFAMTNGGTLMALSVDFGQTPSNTRWAW
ncbi:MAG: PQQ-binding-like beta-propeller repeat protein [Polyangiaceae bacterium]|nr:PQQ-binding-like beta-propeller repeat protein [Polyangiaceae bacterium]